MLTLFRQTMVTVFTVLRYMETLDIRPLMSSSVSNPPLKTHKHLTVLNIKIIARYMEIMFHYNLLSPLILMDAI